MTLRRRLALTILAAAVPLCAALLLWQSAVRRRAQAEALRDMAVSMMDFGGRRLCELSPEKFPSSAGFELSDEQIERMLPMLKDLKLPILEGTPIVTMKVESPKEGERAEGAQPPKAAPAPTPVEGAPPPPASSIPLVGGTRTIAVSTETGVGETAFDPEVDIWAYHRDFHSSNPSAPAFPATLRKAIEGGAEYASEDAELAGKPAMRVAVPMRWNEGPAAIVTVTAPKPPPEVDAGLLRWGLLGLCGALVAAIWFSAGPVVARIRRLQSGVREAAAQGYAKDVEVRGSDEVAGLARAFNEAGAQVRRHVGEVEAREEALRAFVADTTHDVMIPLTVLQGHLADVRDHVRRGDPVPEVAVRMGLEEAHYLGSLLQNLSAAAKLDGREPEHRDEPVDLVRLVERVVERHRPLARARGIALEHSVPGASLAARGDVTLLEQAVNNVVHNAIRHNDDGGHVALVLEPRAGGFALRVLDDGPGVPEGDLERLGTRRFRSEAARTRDPAGRGLGLHIARRVAERHGFTLRFSSVEPHGLEAVLEGGCVVAK